MIRSDNTLSPVYSTKNLAKSIAEDQERDDKVNYVGPNRETAILGQIAVKLKSFGEWYRKLLDEVKDLQDDLFGGIGFNDDEWLSVTAPDDLVDDVNARQAGYCFADSERNNMKRYEEAGLRALFHHPRLKDRFGFMCADDKLVLNAVACHDFLRRASHARTKLATLIHISGGGPARGTEFTANYLRNHPQDNT